MSLLSATQGGPDQVWAVVNLLAQFPDGLNRDELSGWLSPRYRRDGAERPASKAVLPAVNVAKDLALVRLEGHTHLLAVAAPSSMEDFSDLVHESLAGFEPHEPDAVLMEAMAWVVLKCDQEKSFGWLSDWNRKVLADAINRSLPPRAAGDGDDRRFNDVKIPYWFRWLHSVDLMADLGNEGWYPYVAERVARTLRRSGLPTGQELPAQTVLSAISAGMPYLDGGRLWTAAAGRMGFTPPAHLSRVLSVALRDLHDDGRIMLNPLGDQTGLSYLADDRRHKLQSFITVTLSEAGADV